MKSPLVSSIFCLGFLTQFSPVQGDSQLFSKFAGAPTVTASFKGSSASDLTNSFKACTNYLHGLPNADTYPITSEIPQLRQQEADGVCTLCTSVQISRVDSCCAQQSSVSCFQQFAAVTTTGGGASTPTNTKSSNGGKVRVVGSERPLLRVQALTVKCRSLLGPL